MTDRGAAAGVGVPHACPIAFLVCAHNAVGRIRPTLDALAAQAGAACLLVVDNASSDGTADAVRARWSELAAPYPLRIVSELRPGLVHARRCGLDALASDPELAGGAACFVDDDNHLLGDWVGPLAQLFASQPRIGAIGGCGIGMFDGDAPSWWHTLAAGFACGEQGPPGQVEHRRGYLYGAGLAIRLAAWSRIAASFRPLLHGRVGAAMLSGDDEELCYALRRDGWLLWHDPALRFHHHMPLARLTPERVFAMHEGFGRSARIRALLRSQFGGMPIRRCIAGWPALFRTVARLRLGLHLLSCRIRGVDQDQISADAAMTRVLRGQMRAE